MNLSIAGAMFAVGLVTSIHCVFMCGGLVLTYAVKGAVGGPWYRKLVPHLAYQGAKLVSYATVALLLGGLVALIGHTVNITPFRNWLQIVAGIYMVLIGVGMTGKIKALRYLSPRPPKFLVDALSRSRRKANAEAAVGTSSIATPVAFGLLTGLMPCAPLIAAQASAMATGSPIAGAIAMVAFGLGTMPLMLVFGFASSLLSRRLQAKSQIVAALAVAIFGLVIFNRGLVLVGSPVTFDTVRTAVIGGPSPASTAAAQYKKGADGVVEIPMTIANATFEPRTLSVPAGLPFRIVVDRKEANSCSEQLAIPSAGVLADLADNGVTSVDVPAMKAGTFTLTCGMGMISGSLSVGGGAPAAAEGGSAMSLAAVLIVLIAGGYLAYLMWRRRSAVATPAEAEPSSVSGASSTTAAGRGSRELGEPATVALFGFEPAEFVIGGAVVAIAVIIGLASGGFFH